MICDTTLNEAAKEYDTDGEEIIDNFKKLKRILDKNIGRFTNITT